MFQFSIEEKRSIAHHALFVVLLAIFFVLRGSSWTGSMELHTVMETAATLLAFFVGSIALITFYTNKEILFLLVGVGFLGTGLLDGYHALVTSIFFTDLVTAPIPNSLIPWSWVSSRFFLSTTMLLPIYFWYKESRSHKYVIQPFKIYAVFSLFTVGSFIFFIFAPLPAAYYPDLFFTRPEELIPGLFFLISTLFFYFKGDWKKDSFKHWMLLFLMLSTVTQVLFMSFSGKLFDFNFDMAHLLKKGSYLVVLSGLLIAIFARFQDERHSRKILEQKEKQLLEEQKVRLDQLVVLGKKQELLDGNIVELENTRRAVLNILEDLEVERKELAQAKARDDAILEGIGEGLVVTDKDRRIVLINSSGENIIGLSQSSLLGKKWPDGLSEAGGGVFSEEGKAVETEGLPIHQAIVHKKRFTESKYSYKKDKKNSIAVSITASPFMLGDELLWAIVVFRDITSEREIDKAKTEFVSLASHQLRTPLSTIGWYTEMLIAGDAGDITPTQKKYLEEIYTGNKRMVDLVNALLNVSRLELGTFMVDPENISPADLMKDMIKEISVLAKERNITIIESYSEDVVSMSVDPKLLGMVYQNLLSNAIKYTPVGGRVAVEVRPVKKGEKIVSQAVTLDGVLISVSDNGMGIPDDQQNKIFTKLFRADNVQETDTQGTGLGLYIVKAIIDQTSGQLWFDSTEDKGTTFYVILPESGMRKKTGTRKLD